MHCPPPSQIQKSLSSKKRDILTHINARSFYVTHNMSLSLHLYYFEVAKHRHPWQQKMTFMSSEE